MDNLKDSLLKEIEEFRKTGYDFLDGNISVAEFKHESGGMGVYAERSKKTFMIRLRIPSGVVTIDQMKFISNLAEKYGRESIHLTTREAIQFHNLDIDSICEIMKEALNNNIYSRGAGGDFPRNVAMSPLTGVEKEETFDVTSYSVEINNYFLRNITTYKLPRKIKVGISSSNKDLGHCNISDVGFLAVLKDNKKYFKLYLGGGIGRNPKFAIEYDELIEPEEILYYIEAMVRLFVKEGDYNNRAKARIRYIVERLGKEQFIKCYKEHLEEVKENENLKIKVLDKVYSKKGVLSDVKNPRLIEQKQEGLYTVYFHPFGGILALKDLNNILEELEKIEDAEIRLSMTEDLYLRNLNGNEAKRLLEVTSGKGGETALEQSVSCIGVPTCQIGVAESQTLIHEIINYFKNKNYKKDILPKIHVSGCGNSCTVHETCLMGLTGTRKKVDDILVDAFELHINGSFEEGKTRFGKIYGVIIAKDIPELLYKLSLKIEEKNISFYEYLDKYENELTDLVKEYNK